jgi:hypothetical protein
MWVYKMNKFFLLILAAMAWTTTAERYYEILKDANSYTLADQVNAALAKGATLGEYSTSGGPNRDGHGRFLFTQVVFWKDYMDSNHYRLTQARAAKAAADKANSWFTFY